MGLQWRPLPACIKGEISRAEDCGAVLPLAASGAAMSHAFRVSGLRFSQYVLTEDLLWGSNSDMLAGNTTPDDQILCAECINEQTDAALIV